ncbi:MAG: DNA alkylation repair protein [Oscillospiraceae bacterium]|jgi:3-methyladenine DNA glycosylase AlkD|nr:DNA alkylation repair protein [Oscillospiraceae bacterium]
MDFKGIWSEQKHSRFIEYLKEFADLKYKEFNSRLINDDRVDCIGVRALVLRKFAKLIAQNDYQGFINHSSNKYHEELAIYGLIIGYAKLDYDQLMTMLKSFAACISNWALSDIASTKFKQILANKNDAFEKITKFTESKNPWEIRFGLVLILNIFVEEAYIDRILEICSAINSEHYYAKMGNAWLISECFIQFPQKTQNMLQAKVLDKWTQNKAIQKIKESRRTKNFAKQKLELLKVPIRN